jgi:hypothetical protein
LRDGRRQIPMPRICYRLSIALRAAYIRPTIRSRSWSDHYGDTAEFRC